MASDDMSLHEVGLHEQFSRRQAEVDRILDLIDKAQARSADDPENNRKWNKILDRLWRSLDEARARLAESEAELEYQRRKSKLPGMGAGEAAAETPPPSSPSARPETRIGQRESSPLSSREFHERRRQLMLRSALEKVKTARIDLMTLEEVELAAECLERLSQRAEADPADERLAQVFATLPSGLAETLAEMRRQRARLYTKKGH